MFLINKLSSALTKKAVGSPAKLLSIRGHSDIKTHSWNKVYNGWEVNDRTTVSYSGKCSWPEQSLSLKVVPKPTDPVKTWVISLHDPLSTGRSLLGISFHFIHKNPRDNFMYPVTTHSPTQCHCMVLRAQNTTALESSMFQMERTSYWPQTRPVGFPQHKQLPRSSANSSVSWVKRDQLDATCFIITLFSAQHVSDVNTSILRSLQLIRW